MPPDADGEFDLLAHGDRDETWRKLGKLVTELGVTELAARDRLECAPSEDGCSAA